MSARLQEQKVELGPYDQQGSPTFEVEGLPRETKWSFVTRNVPIDAVSCVDLRLSYEPQSGDLLLATVVELAQHTRLQLRGGRRSQLYPGDRIVVAYGHRYAPDQFEAVVPTDLDTCHLVASGGIAAKAVSKHSALKWPTVIRPEGLCTDTTGQVINLRQYPLVVPIGVTIRRKPVIAVLGTSMNSGKTTAVAALVRGLTTAGFRVSAVKATGTGAGNDVWAYADAGARLVLDFTDAGYPSTFRLPAAEIEACLGQLLTITAGNADIDITVVEIADGLLQVETAQLIRSQTFQDQVDHTLFAASDAMGAAAGLGMLKQAGLDPIALVGRITASRLSTKEAERATGLRSLTRGELAAPNTAADLLR